LIPGLMRFAALISILLPARGAFRLRGTTVLVGFC